MRSLVVDKIASVALESDIGSEVRISPEIPCEEGVLVAVEVLNNKSRYNTLELTSGRMAQIKRGDIIVGALGHRKALFGYSGHIPDKIVPGDVIQLLNRGGVLGICDSVNPTQGQPFDCRVLGVILEFPYLGERIGVPARVGSPGQPTEDGLDIGEVDVDIPMHAIKIVSPAHEIEAMLVFRHLLRRHRVDAIHALEHATQYLLAVQRIFRFGLEPGNVNNQRTTRHFCQSDPLIALTAGSSKSCRSGIEVITASGSGNSSGHSSPLRLIHAVRMPASLAPLMSVSG